MLRGWAARLARRVFPSQEANDRIMPWLRIAATVAGGIWALVQYSTSIADRRADDTVKLLATYSADSDKKPSLQYVLHTLSEESLAYAKSDAQLQALMNNSKKTEAEKAETRKQLVARQRAYAVQGDHYNEYWRLNSYLTTVVSCASERRCTSEIVNSVLGDDFLNFLNDSCGFIEEADDRWRTVRTGLAIFDYVVDQKLENQSEAQVAIPFLCCKFRIAYARKKSLPPASAGCP